MSTELRDLIRDLGLAPHPEGGWYREIHRSPGRLQLERGPRSALTVIDYVVEVGGYSAFHRVSSEEVWSWCAGAPLELFLLGPKGRRERFLLGPERAAGQHPLVVVPAGFWQAARPLAGSPSHADYTWCSCVVAPGFDFEDFELAERETLLAQYPEHKEWIERLTR